MPNVLLNIGSILGRKSDIVALILSYIHHNKSRGKIQEDINL